MGTIKQLHDKHLTIYAHWIAWFKGQVGDFQKQQRKKIKKFQIAFSPNFLSNFSVTHFHFNEISYLSNSD